MSVVFFTGLPVYSMQVYVLGLRTVVCRRPSLGDSYLGDEAQRAGVLSLPRISCKSTYAPYRESASTDGVPAADDDLVSVSSGPAATGPTNSSRSSCAVAGTGTGAIRGSISGDGSTWGSLSSDATAGQGVGGAGVPVAGEGEPHRPGDMPPEWVTHGLAGRLRDRLGLQLFNFDLICPEVQESGSERLYYVVDINYFPGGCEALVCRTCGQAGALGRVANGMPRVQPWCGVLELWAWYSWGLGISGWYPRACWVEPRSLGPLGKCCRSNQAAHGDCKSLPQPITRCQAA